MRDTPANSNVPGRGAFQPSAKRFRRRAGWKILRASHTVNPPPEPLIYWHRDLPPLDAEPIQEHTLDATSEHLPHDLEHGDDLWDCCYHDLLDQVRTRLEQEIARLDGNYAHVLEEHIESKYDGAKNEGWLQGRFRYVLYRRATNPVVPKTCPQLR